MKWMIFTTALICFYLLLMRFTARRRAMGSRVQTVTVGHVTPTSPSRKWMSGVSMRGIARRMASNWVRKWSQTRLEKIHMRLFQAGNPLNLSVAEWIGVRLLLTGTGVAIGVFLLGLATGPLTGLAMLLGSLLLGWLGPEFWLSRRIRQRQEEILKQLPSVLDILTVSVEAGLGFDQAMSRVADKMQGPLADEFNRALHEIQYGSPRATALQRLADRAGVDPVKLFVSAVIQADRLGIGLAQVLRVQSADVRRRRRMDAEERAMKAPVKMLFPLVLFVFPALFVIILGPAFLHIMKIFGHGGA